jgi:hypothetical protein
MRSMGSTTNGGRPPLAPSVGACSVISDTSSTQSTIRFISSRNSRLRVLLVLHSHPLSLRLNLLLRGTASHRALSGEVAQTLPTGHHNLPLHLSITLRRELYRVSLKRVNWQIPHHLEVFVQYNCPEMLARY